MMRDFAGKTAFVTGGASGIGLAMAQAFGTAGMKVMIADIEEGALSAAVASVKETGAEARGIVCDVADRDSVQRAADETFAAFGKVHVLCNNAGVGTGGPMDGISRGDWEWVIGVNIWGPINGIQAFLPHMKAHGEAGHIVNTSSIVAWGGAAPGIGPYTATKCAIVGLTETLAAELDGTAIGVTVVSPGATRTRIADSARNRPKRFGAQHEVPKAALEQLAAFIRAGIDPKEVARRVMTAIRDNDLYVFTHAADREGVEERFRRVLADYDKSAPG
jgi:NAD(P)-dependent dehydrogenase (short-subunit alcohol dehydrogenase family)